MLDWRHEINGALSDFEIVSELAGDHLSLDETSLEFLDAPHRPPRSLPRGKMAVYGFWSEGEWLKIGKVGPNSNARYTSQHYNPNSALSTLAASLLRDERMLHTPAFDQAVPGEWIKAKTSRVNILIPSGRRYSLLSLLEAFLHARWKPRYEG